MTADVSPRVFFLAATIAAWLVGGLWSVVGPPPSPRVLAAETAAQCALLGGFAVAPPTWEGAACYVVTVVFVFVFGAMAGWWGGVCQ